MLDDDTLAVLFSHPETASTFQVGQLAASLIRLRGGVRATAAWWDGNRPDAAGFEVADSFRRLVDRGDADG